MIQLEEIVMLPTNIEVFKYSNLSIV